MRVYVLMKTNTYSNNSNQQSVRNKLRLLDMQKQVLDIPFTFVLIVVQA